MFADLDLELEFQSLVQVCKQLDLPIEAPNTHTRDTLVRLLVRVLVQLVRLQEQAFESEEG